MTVKEYLNQGYRLEQRIGLLQDEIQELRQMSVSISSPGFGEHHNPNRSTSAPYERLVIKIMELEEQSARQLEKLIHYKEELKQVIHGLEDKDERMVLYYRYICNKTWSSIADTLFADERTVRRWHNRAIDHVTIPDSPTIIDDHLLK